MAYLSVNLWIFRFWIHMQIVFNQSEVLVVQILSVHMILNNCVSFIFPNFFTSTGAIYGIPQLHKQPARTLQEITTNLFCSEIIQNDSNSFFIVLTLILVLAVSTFGNLS
ncbi:hypothetical protein DKK73_05140 [Bifidobacterium asteroides]|nr:hypothetical protein DKK73_05140 [Bifidobacterium asteroides]